MSGISPIRYGYNIDGFRIEKQVPQTEVSKKNRLGKQDLAPTSNIALQIGLGEKIKLGLKPHFRKSQNLQHTHITKFTQSSISGRIPVQLRPCTRSCRFLSKKPATDLAEYKIEHIVARATIISGCDT